MQRYAIVFRVHFWDDFARRQLDRLRSVVREGDVFVVLDETAGPVAGVEHDRIVRMTESDLLGMGLVGAGEGNMMWFNGDYPLYRFRELHPEYDYYLQTEYDLVFNTSPDAIVARAQAEGIEFIGLSKGEDIEHWPWTDTCTDAYAREDIDHQLICVSLYSGRALDHLLARRLTLSQAYRSGAIQAWPMCEAFVATEMRRGGFRCAELSAFGDTGAYDHWPPLLERDLDCTPGEFLHPVLDDRRYAGSLLKYKIGLLGYLRPDSLFHRKARRLPLRLYVRLVATSFWAKARRTLRDAAQSIQRRAPGAMR